MFVGTDVACLKGGFHAINNCVNVYVAPVHLMHDATSRIDAKHPLTSARLAATQFAVRMMRRLAGAVGRLPHERL